MRTVSPKVLNTFSAWLESERATFLPFDLDADPKHSTLAFRKHEADFQVEEVLAFEPSGEGHHLFLRIEKKGALYSTLYNGFRNDGVFPEKRLALRVGRTKEV